MCWWVGFFFFFACFWWVVKSSWQDDSICKTQIEAVSMEAVMQLLLPLRKVREICRQLPQHVDLAGDYRLLRQEHKTEENRTCRHKTHGEKHFLPMTSDVSRNWQHLRVGQAVTPHYTCEVRSAGSPLWKSCREAEAGLWRPYLKLVEINQGLFTSTCFEWGLKTTCLYGSVLCDPVASNRLDW